MEVRSTAEVSAAARAQITWKDVIVVVYVTCTTFVNSFSAIKVGTFH
jgi:hypothetical protein